MMVVHVRHTNIGRIRDGTRFDTIFSIHYWLLCSVDTMALKPYRATSHWKKIRLEILRRDSYTCTYCGDVANEVDHIVAKVKGGEDTYDNLVAACRTCNIQKKDHDEAVFLARRSTDRKSVV